MLNLRIMSDLHIEWDKCRFKFPHDKDCGNKQVLILAGDIAPSRIIINWMKDIFENTRFKKVLFICGNHEFYNAHQDEVIKNLKRNFPANMIEFNKIVFLENDIVEIEDTTFLGCTLWSDFLKENPQSIQACNETMNDYQLIKSWANMGLYGDNRFVPEEALTIYKKSKEFLETELRRLHKDNNKKKSVVITHMAPCELSIPERFKQDERSLMINGAYYSDLSEMILDYEPDIWIHGHTHDSFDYTVGKTRIICNPRGYVGHSLNPDFKEQLNVSI